MAKDYYYQIKGKSDFGSGFNWHFPPIHSGKVTAKDKKEAKKLIDEEYQQVFPLRVLKKDIEKHHYLLSIKEIKDDDIQTKELFNTRICKECNSTFRRIDLYNDSNERYKGLLYCSYECSESYRHKNLEFSHTLNGCVQPVIYKITNKNTGLSYVGKTTQVFTLRWYQHFFHPNNSKFHMAIICSKIDEWIFEIIEIISFPKDADQENYFSERERHWIKTLDTIENGYNSKL